MYKNRVCYKYPGLLIILVDQTAFMEDKMPNDYCSMAEAVSNVLNLSLSDVILRLTSCYDNENEFVKNYFLLNIIGYTNEDAHIICDDWIDVVAEKYPIERVRVNTQKGDFTVKCNKIITPVAEGFGGMEHAFTYAKELVNRWGTLHNAEDDVPPMIINITRGILMGDLENIKNEANEIMKFPFYDGNPLLINIHLTSDNNVIDNEVKLLSSISTPINDDIRDRFSPGFKEESIRKNIGDTFLYTNVASSKELYEICTSLMAYIVLNVLDYMPKTYK